MSATRLLELPMAVSMAAGFNCPGGCILCGSGENLFTSIYIPNGKSQGCPYLICAGCRLQEGAAMKVEALLDKAWAE